jgi:hypothetical protein
MLGPLKPRRLDEPIAVSLEDLVPANNVYRHLVTSEGIDANGIVEAVFQHAGAFSEPPDVPMGLIVDNTMRDQRHLATAPIPLAALIVSWPTSYSAPSPRATSATR